MTMLLSFSLFRKWLLVHLVPEIVWPREVVLDGVEISIRHAPYSFGVKRLLCRNQYERPERELVRDVIRPGMAVIEMGSSLGIVTAVIASLTGDVGTVVAVEASKELAEYSKTWLEKKFPQVRVIQGFGFPVTRAPPELCVSGFENNGVSLGGRVSFSLDGSPPANVSAGSKFDIATLMETFHMPSPDALVIDIEGAESVVLQAGMSIPDSVKHVVIELHPQIYVGGHAEEARIVEFFASQGLTLARKVGLSCLFSRTTTLS